MAFNLGALGAGLGQFAQQYQQQQEAALRQQQMKLQMAQFQQKQQKQLEQQRQREAMGRLFGLASSGGLDQQTIPGQTVGGARSGSDLGGGLRAGGALTGDPLDLIEKYESGGRNVMQGVVPPGGGYNPSVGRVTGPSSAGGYFQMIDPTWRAAASKVGIDTDQYPRAIDAPRELQRKAAQYLYDTEGFRPWAPYNPALRSAVRRSGAPQVTQASYSQPTAPPDAVIPQAGRTVAPATAAPAPMGNMGQDGAAAGDYGDGGDIMAPVRQEVQQGIQGVAKITPPSVFGKMGLSGLAQQIEKAAPGAEPAVKFMMLQEAQGLLAPDAKMQLELYKEQRQHEWQTAFETFKAGLPQRHAPELFEDTAGEQHWLQPGKDPPQGWRKVSGAGGGVGKPALLEYTKEDGTVDRIQAQQTRNGQWVTADEKRSPIDVSQGKWSVIPASAASALGGSRDSAQRERQLTSAREVVSDLQNVVDLPVTTTRGWFGGRTQGPGLLDALKENLAETLTSEDAELANSALSGVERELSIVVSPVYGGKWAAESFKPLMLKEGQTNLVKLYNIARMRQTVDNALETVITSPRLGEAQKVFAKEMREMMDKAVPWTPRDVIVYRQKDNPGETFGQFVASQGIAGAEKRGGEREDKGSADPNVRPLPPGYEKYDDGFAFRSKTTGETWVKKGNRLIKTPGAVASPSGDGGVPGYIEPPAR